MGFIGKSFLKFYVSNGFVAAPMTNPYLKITKILSRKSPYSKYHILEPHEYWEVIYEY